MAETIGNEYPNVIRITLGGSDVLTEVTLPRWTKRLSVQFITNPGKLALEGIDGASIGTDYMTIAADTWFELSMSLNGVRNTGRDSVFLASGTGSTVVEVVVEG